MVDISSQNNKINVTVSSSGNTANTNVTPDYAQYYSEKSKEWAISDRIVDNTDYSSKYYANESKKQADISTAKATEVIESGNNAISNIEGARDNALSTVNQGVNQLNTTITNGLENINNSVYYGVGTIETLQANSIAEITTNKESALSDITTAETNVLANIDTTKLNTLAQIEELANSSIEDINATGIDTKVSKSGDIMTGPLNISRNETALYKVTNSAITLGSTPSSRVNIGGMWYLDGANHLAGIIQCYVGTTGETGFQFITRKPDNSAWGAYLDLHTNTDGTIYFDFPKCTTKATTTSSAASSKVAVVVQNYVNGTSWYRVWSDGWIEQGGSLTINEHTTATVTFIKPFSNTNYTLLYTQGGWHDGYTRSDTGITAITTTNFKIGSSSGCSTLGRWYACGY